MIGRYDIRWHDERSGLLGSIVQESTEQEALYFAASRMASKNVHTARILHKGDFIFTIKRD